jgi:CRP-like cAMP-binding protein
MNSMFEPQYFLHMANIVLVVAYSVKDILWLRVFALGASLFGLPYYYLQPTVLWEPIGWSAVFMTINGYHVCRLWLDRRPVDLSPDEERLYDLTFFPLARRRFRDLVRLGHWVDLKAGDVLIRPDRPAEHIAVPLDESIDVKVGERILGRFAAGAIVGAGAFFDSHRMQFEAVASEPCRVLRVSVDAIRHQAERDDQLARTLERIARDDLARKLAQVVTFAANHSEPASPADRRFGQGEAR